MKYLAPFLLVLLFGLSPALAESKALKGSMQGAFHTFAELQPYLVDSQEFQKPENHKKILNYIRTLSASFHTAESAPSKYKNKPGFLAMLFVMNTALDDALNSFNEGDKDWAAWRLKTVSGTCVSCHSSFGVDVRYQYPDASLAHLSDYEKAELYLISRQVKKAKQGFYDAAIKAAKDGDHQQMVDALRRLLVIYTRFDLNPKEALQKLVEISKIGKLSEYESSLVKQWEAAFTAWGKEKNPAEVSFKKAKELTQSALGEDPLLSQTGSVELLRASGILHQLFLKGKLKDKEKSQALYYLGAIYAKLSLFVINEMPQFYLELCIREFPGTDDAKRSYRLYHELTAYGYTGSGGMDLPEVVKEELKELRDIAYGVKQFQPHV